MKAVIITSQRTGSTFLVECLDSHPQIRCYPELFLKNGKYYDPEARRRPAQFLDSFYTRNEAAVMAFKVMYNQLIIDPRLMWYIVKNTDIRVVHLRRDNLLRQHVSNMLNKQRLQLGRPAHTATSVPVASIYINPRQAILRMRKVQWMFEFFSHLLRKHPRIELVYENMIDGQFLSSEVASRITRLFDIDDAPMYSDLVKLNPDNLEEMIQNYDEVVRALRGTLFERFLEWAETVQ